MKSKVSWAITNCRVSSDKQLESGSLSHQAEAVKKAAKDLGVIIPPDGQWSGSVSSKRGRNLERKDINEMLAYCKKHHPKVKYLIINEPDRFMRSVQEAFYFETVFEKLDVQIYYACDPELNCDNSNARLQRFMKYYVAEGSNEERQRKSINGGVAAIREGRFPYHPKFGYMKNPDPKKPGIHVPIPEMSDVLRSSLVGLAEGFMDLHESLAEYNNSHYVQSGKRKPTTYDEWKRIVVDPYYAGVVQMDKQVKAYCEKGLHEPLITMEQHKKILAIVENTKKRYNGGPKKGGNPLFPLNSIVFHKECWENFEALGKTPKQNRGKLVGFKSTNGKSNKEYSRYKCRSHLCHLTIRKEELHKEVENLLNSLELTPERARELKSAMKDIWKLEVDNNATEIRGLRSRLGVLEREKTDLTRSMSMTTNQDVFRELEGQLSKKISEIKMVEEKVAELQGGNIENFEKFAEFGIDFATHLGSNFLNLTPEYARKCKLLLFPNGIFVDDEKKVYISEISPIYRGRDTKKDSKNCPISGNGGVTGTQTLDLCLAKAAL